MKEMLKDMVGLGMYMTGSIMLLCTGQWAAIPFILGSGYQVYLVYKSYRP